MSSAKEQPLRPPVKAQSRDLDHVRAVLRDWLAERLGAPDLELGAISTPSGTGVANETLLFDGVWHAGGREHRQGFAARLSALTPLYDDADLSRQYRMYEALADVEGVPVPAVIGYEADPNLLGGPFFVAERVEGTVPADSPRHYTEEGFVCEATPAQRRLLWEDAVDVLARLHCVPNEQVAFLDRPELGASGLEQELQYWRNYLDRSTAGRPHEHLEAGWEWLVKHRPADPPTSLSWGDARVPNIIFRDFRCVAVLDWDTASLAGPEVDLAWWIWQERHAASLAGIGGPAELLDRWETQTGRRCRPLHWAMAFTGFRLGAVRTRLFDLWVADGHMTPEEAEVARNSGPVELLAVLTDLPLPRGELTITMPDIPR